MFTPAYPAGQGGRGGRAQSADATSACGDPALQSRHPGLARRDPARAAGGRSSSAARPASYRGSPRPGFNEQIAGSRLELFGADEGGQHFMFMENPTKFNAVVGEFLG